MMMMRTATSFLCLLLTLVAGDPDCDWTTCTGATSFNWKLFNGKWYVKSQGEVADDTMTSLGVVIDGPRRRSLTVKEKVLSLCDDYGCVEKNWLCTADVHTATTACTSGTDRVTVTVLAHSNHQSAIVRVMRGNKVDGIYLQSNSPSTSANFDTLSTGLTNCFCRGYKGFETVEQPTEYSNCQI